MKLSDKVYNVLKWLGLVFFYALADFINMALPVWGVDSQLVNALVVTSNALGLFVGVCIGISHITIKKENAQKEEEAEEFIEGTAEDEIIVDDSEINEEV